jgi:hypothetical protein
MHSDTRTFQLMVTPFQRKSVITIIYSFTHAIQRNVPIRLPWLIPLRSPSALMHRLGAAPTFLPRKDRPRRDGHTDVYFDCHSRLCNQNRLAAINYANDTIAYR